MSDNSGTILINTTTSQFFDFILIAIICFIFFSGYSFNLYDTTKDCKSRWSSSGLPVKHTSGSGCIIKIKNVWVKEENIKFSLPDTIIKK